MRFGIVLILIICISLLIVQAVRCEKSGGVYVKAVFGYHCVGRL